MPSYILNALVLIAGSVALLIVILNSARKGRDGTFYKMMQRRLWNKNDDE